MTRASSHGAAPRNSPASPSTRLPESACVFVKRPLTARPRVPDAFFTLLRRAGTDTDAVRKITPDCTHFPGLTVGSPIVFHRRNRLTERADIAGSRHGRHHYRRGRRRRIDPGAGAARRRNPLPDI